MLRRVLRAFRLAARDAQFGPVFGAALALVIIGTAAYPSLVLEHRWTKIFTVLYLLVGIGVLVEMLRRLGIAFVAVQAAEKEKHADSKHGRAAS